MTHIVDRAIAPLSSAIVRGTLRRVGGPLLIADLAVVLDTHDSVPFAQR